MYLTKGAHWNLACWFLQSSFILCSAGYRTYSFISPNIHWGVNAPLTIAAHQYQSTQEHLQRQYHNLDNISGLHSSIFRLVRYAYPWTRQSQLPLIYLCLYDTGTASMMIDHFPFCNRFVEIESIYIVFELVSESLNLLHLPFPIA